MIEKMPRERRPQAVDPVTARGTRSCHALFDAAGESIFMVDLNGDCTYCNRACLRSLGYLDADDLLARNMHLLTHHPHADGAPFGTDLCQLHHTLTSGAEQFLVDQLLRRADGSSFRALSWSWPQRRDGAVVGAVVFFAEIAGE